MEWKTCLPCFETHDHGHQIVQITFYYVITKIFYFVQNYTSGEIFPKNVESCLFRWKLSEKGDSSSVKSKFGNKPTLYIIVTSKKYLVYMWAYQILVNYILQCKDKNLRFFVQTSKIGKLKKNVGKLLVPFRMIWKKDGGNWKDAERIYEFYQCVFSFSRNSTEFPSYEIRLIDNGSVRKGQFLLQILRKNW